MLKFTGSSIKCLILAAAAFLFCQTIFSQPSKTGSWETINVTYKDSKHLIGFIELQARSQRVTTDFYYHEVKGGIGYNLPKKFSAIIAIGDYRTYAYPGNFKDLQTKEFRLWQQFSFSGNLGVLKMEHRYRTEQRWLNGNYRNRFRYRFNPVLPLNKKTIEPGALYLSMFDELFFTNRAPYFERNRFFVGAGYQFSRRFALQSGILRQFDYRKSDDGTGKNFIQTSLLFFLDKDLDFSNRHPGAAD